MALVSVIFGGVFGFAAATIAGLCGASALTALAIWSGSGLALAGLILGLAHFPRHCAENRMAAQKT